MKALSKVFKSCTIVIGISLFLSACRNSPLNFDASQAEKGVVRVAVLQDLGGNITWASGSGFQIGDDMIVTNYHVVEDAEGNTLVVACKKSDTAIEIRDATVLHKDEELDFAILKVPDLSGDNLTLSEAAIEKGSRAFAIGFPSSADASRNAGSKQGEGEAKFIDLVFAPKRGIVDNASSDLVEFLDPTVSSGEVRKLVVRKWKPENATKLEVIDHDVNIGHGNSGGPLFDICGRVIGINTAGIDLSAADSVKNSSRVTELIKFLKQNNISANITSSPCESATSSSFSLWFFVTIIVALSFAAGGIAFNRKNNKESYTQFIKRGSSLTSFLRKTSSEGPVWEKGEIINAPSDSKTSGSARQLPLDSASSGSESGSSLGGNWVLVGDDPASGVSIDHAQIERNGGSLTIGRKIGVSDVVIPNTSLSKLHATLSLLGSRLQIADNHSSNGTKINGVRLTPEHLTLLEISDQITLGEVNLTVQSLGENKGSDDPSPQATTRILENPAYGIYLTLNLHSGRRLILGRKAASAQLVVDNASVSKIHASMSINGREILVTDLNSSNGTKINNQRIQPGKPTLLKPGAILQLGEIPLTLR